MSESMFICPMYSISKIARILRNPLKNGTTVKLVLFVKPDGRVISTRVKIMAIALVFICWHS
jgi:hypothetical protein